MLQRLVIHVRLLVCSAKVIVGYVHVWRVASAASIAVASVGCGASAPSEAPQCLRTFRGHSEYVCSVALSPSGRQIVSGGADGKIKFWDVESGECQRTLDGHTEWVHAVTLSSDGRLLASGGRDDLVKLWEVESGERQKTFVGHSGLIKSVAYSADGRLLASCGRDKDVRIWDVASGKCVKILGTGDFFTSSTVAFTADGKAVFLGGDSLQLWDIAVGECQRTFEGHSDSVGAIAISPNDKWLASAGSYTDRSLRLWDPKSGSCLWKKDFTEKEGGAWSLVFVAEGNVLASGHSDGRITYWDVRSGKQLHALKAHAQAVSSLSTDIKGEYLVSGSWDNSIKLWKVSLDDQVER